MLRAIIEKFAGGPVGLNTVAAAISEDQSTIENVYEPFLIQLGFIARTPRGRVAMPAAYEHLGINVPPSLTTPQSDQPTLL
jgi:Holliday junction DNA helicase RuvB